MFPRPAEKWRLTFRAGLKMSLYVRLFLFFHPQNLSDAKRRQLRSDALTVSPSLRQDDEDFDDDYESPYSGDEEGKGCESSDDDVANDYEPTPSEPPEDHKLCPMLPIGDSEYIGDHQGGLHQHCCFYIWK